MNYKTETEGPTVAIQEVKTPLPAKKRSKKKKKESSFDFVASYLPESICIPTLLKKHPISFKGFKGTKKPHEIKDNMTFLLGSITKLQARNKDSVIENAGFVNLSSKIMQGSISDYNRYIDWALDRELIECDGIYIPKQKCLGYRFNPKTGAKLRMIELYKDNIIKANRSIGICKKTIKKYPFLWLHFKKLEIDMQGVRKEIELLREPTRVKIYEERISEWEKLDLTEKEINQKLDYWTDLTLETWRTSAERIERKEWLFKQDDNVGRLHTNLTGLKRELRKHLTINGEKLIGIDVKNSQPYFASTLFIPENWKKLDLMRRILRLNKTLRYSQTHTSLPTHIPLMLGDLWTGKESKNIETYSQMSREGWLYEYMIDLFDIHLEGRTDRDSMKKAFLKVIFSPTWLNERNKLRIPARLTPMFRQTDPLSHFA